MPISNSVSNRKYVVITICWLIFIAVMFGYFVQLRLVSFDEKNQLANLTPAQIVEHAITLVADDKPLPNRVVHFVSPSCHCNGLTAPHKAQITQQAQAAGFISQSVTVDAGNASVIPATPAILITDHHGELLYFGPYATGLACSQENSLVEVVLNNYQQGFNSALVVGDAQGCYCQNG